MARFAFQACLVAKLQAKGPLLACNGGGACMDMIWDAVSLPEVDHDATAEISGRLGKISGSTTVWGESRHTVSITLVEFDAKAVSGSLLLNVDSAGESYLSGELGGRVYGVLEASVSVSTEGNLALGAGVDLGPGAGAGATFSFTPSVVFQYFYVQLHNAVSATVLGPTQNMFAR